MPTICYTPEKLTHENAKPFPKVAAFTAGELHIDKAGNQPIDPIIWNKVRNSENFKERIEQLIDRGVLEVIDESDKPTLAGRTPAKALAMVKDTYDVGLLKLWKEQEPTPHIAKAIDAQLTILTPPPEKKAS
jgi:hypothetical protein